METIVKLYTRKRCPLCDKAKKIIYELKESIPFQVEEVDIELNDELTEKYGLMIPVVEVDGEEVQYGQIDPLALKMYLLDKIHTT